MKYLKTFEHFSGQDYGRFSDMESDEQEWLNQMKQSNSEEEEEYGDSLRPLVTGRNSEEEEECAPCGEEEEETSYGSQMARTPRVWGDEVVEAKKAKPDFLDLDGDGDKKEPMKKAAKEAKEKEKKDDKKSKGLSASQKKLPEGLRKAIEAKMKKK